MNNGRFAESHFTFGGANVAIRHFPRARSSGFGTHLGGNAQRGSAYSVLSRSGNRIEAGASTSSFPDGVVCGARPECASHHSPPPTDELFFIHSE